MRKKKDIRLLLIIMGRAFQISKHDLFFITSFKRFFERKRSLLWQANTLLFMVSSVIG